MPRKWKPGEKKRMRMAWAKPCSVKSGIVPNRAVIQQYKQTAAGLGLEEARTRFPNVAPGRKDISDRIEDILGAFDDPLFITIIDNTFQRCRLFFNGEMTCYILQHVNWKTREVRLSITYATKQRALQVWTQSKVCWIKKMSLPPPN